MITTCKACSGSGHKSTCGCGNGVMFLRGCCFPCRGTGSIVPDNEPSAAFKLCPCCKVLRKVELGPGGVEVCSYCESGIPPAAESLSTIPVGGVVAFGPAQDNGFEMSYEPDPANGTEVVLPSNVVDMSLWLSTRGKQGLSRE